MGHRLSYFDRQPAVATYVRERVWRLSLDELLAAIREGFPLLAPPSRSSLGIFVKRVRDATGATRYGAAPHG